MLRHYSFHSSRYLAWLLGLANVAVFAGLLTLPLPIWSKALLFLLLLINLLYCLWRHAWLQAPGSSIGLILNNEGVVLLRRDGERIPCALLPGSLVTPYLTVLRFAPRGAGALVILPDSIGADAFRQLRVWLKWGFQNVDS